MNSGEVHLLEQLNDYLDQIADDAYEARKLYRKWSNDEAYVEEGVHVDRDVLSSAPAAGDLAAGEVALGEGTGPNGQDEVFWSVDGQTVARVEADAIIT